MPSSWRLVVRRCRPWLGTFVEIAADSPEAIEAGFAAIAHVHARMSFHEAGSDLSALRDAAAGDIVAVDCETVTVLRLATRLYEESDGLFDVTIGRQLVVSGFLPRLSAHPLRHFSGTAADTEIVSDTQIICHRPVLIDLGGIAKGHAVDLAVAAMQAAGAEQGIVNASGDLRVFGPEAETIWLRAANGALASSIDVCNFALATSSNLLFRRTVRGSQASPHFGPSRKPVLSDHAITILAPTCAFADAMTKIAMADPTRAEIMLAHEGGSLIITPALSQAA